MGDSICCGTMIDEQIVFGMGNSESLRVFNSSLKLIKEIKLTNCPIKLLLIEDYEYLLCGEFSGYIDIVDVLTW